MIGCWQEEGSAGNLPYFIGRMLLVVVTLFDVVTARDVCGFIEWCWLGRVLAE